MTIDYICEAVRNLLEKYDERRPQRLARDMGIILCYEPMGTGERACKGFFLYQSRQRLITINSDLDEDKQRIILAHELGHATLHCGKDSSKAFHDFAMYDSASMLEYEANLFAAELLLDDELVLERLREDELFFAAAKNLGVPAEILDFKLRILKHRGFNLQSPIQARSDFLKKQI